MSILLQGLILPNHYADYVMHKENTDTSKWEVYCTVGGDEITIGTFDDESSAKTFISSLQDKIVALGSSHTIDMRS